jgi:hypothetical protein
MKRRSLVEEVNMLHYKIKKNHLNFELQKEEEENFVLMLLSVLKNVY